MQYFEDTRNPLDTLYMVWYSTCIDKRSTRYSRKGKTMDLIASSNKKAEIVIGSIIPLHESGMEGVKVVSRKIDEKNLQSLLYAEGAWPPIKVQKTSDGYILVDGHHRLKAAQLLSIRKYAIANEYWPNENGQPVPADLTVYKEVWQGLDGTVRDFLEEEQQYADEQTIASTFVNARTPYELCRIAWQCNRQNGMQPKGEAVGRYGLWLYQESHREGNEPLSYAQCAKEAGCSKAAILNFASRHAGDDSLSEGELPVEAKEAVGLSGRREKDARALVKAMARFYDHSEELTTDELANLVSEQMKASEYDLPKSVATILHTAAGILKDEFDVQPAEEI